MLMLLMKEIGLSQQGEQEGKTKVYKLLKFGRTIPQSIFLQMDEGIEKQMASTNRKQKIFNVRKLHHKHFDPHDKYIKPQFSPLQVKEHLQEPSTQKVGKKAAEYNFQIAIISSAPYKELNKRYGQIKEENQREKEKRLKQLKEKQEQLVKFQAERQRLAIQREKLAKRRDEIKSKIQQIRGRNQQLRSQQMQRNEEYRIMNMEYLRNMLMSMRYQNGIDIDIDNMNYEQLLQLEQKIGSVSKGLTEEQLKKLQIKIATGKGEEAGQGLCSICYDDIKEGQQILTLPCKHVFHNSCIKQWLAKQKACPMCKQQIILEASRASQRKIEQTNSRVEEGSNSRIEQDNQS